MGAITVFLADDSAIIRAGVSAMLQRDPDVEVVGVADDYDSLVAGAEAANPDVIVSDIRMPPHFTSEGIDACKEIRKRHPGTGVVILSQYDDPDYAVSLLAEGSAGYAYLLKDRIAEGDQLARAIREVATGGSMLDPVIVSALINPVRRTGGLSTDDEELLEMVANGRTIKAIAVALNTTPSAVDDRVERLFVHLAEGVSSGQAGALDRLRRLHQAIVQREEQGESLSRLLPTGVAEQLLAGGPGRRRDRDARRHRGDERHPRLHLDRRARRSRGAGTTAESPPGRDEPCHSFRGWNGDAVRRRCGDGGVRRARVDPRSRRPGARCGTGDAPRAGRGQRRMVGGGPHPVRPRHRAEHRHRRRRAARQRGAGRVHPGRRRREPVPALAAVRRTRPDRAQRTDVGRPHRPTDRVRASSTRSWSKGRDTPVVPYRLPSQNDSDLETTGAPT